MKALFLTNQLFIDTAQKEGGVRNCTLEFIRLLERKYQLVLFPVQYNLSVGFRLAVKLGLNAYNEYNTEKYFQPLKRVIDDNEIAVVFLNLTNTQPFAKLIKEKINPNIPIYLCSHGNESGDFLHTVVFDRAKHAYFQKIVAEWKLGSLLRQEATFRRDYLNGVLTVSEIESNIEKWLGAENVWLVPREIKPEFLNWTPVNNRIGFMGDLSHTPNLKGVETLCEELKKNNFQGDFRLIGGTSKIGNQLAKTYPFITYCGYLSEELVKKEVATWSLFLNLVFYYSRGVSTKLAKALAWGIPVISTIQGNRGYLMKDEQLETAKNVQHFNLLLKELLCNEEKLLLYHQQLKELILQQYVRKYDDYLTQMLNQLP